MCALQVFMFGAYFKIQLSAGAIICRGRQRPFPVQQPQILSPTLPPKSALLLGWCLVWLRACFNKRGSDRVQTWFTGLDAWPGGDEEIKLNIISVCRWKAVARTEEAAKAVGHEPYSMRREMQPFCSW